jgi:hypothetical protein
MVPSDQSMPEQDPPAETVNPHAAWDEKYDDLFEFYQRFGHCYVPLPWPEQPALGIWVQTQRREHLTMAPDQVARLDAIHFFWTDGWENLGANWREEQKRVLGRFYHDPDQPPDHFSINHIQRLNVDDDTEDC